MSGSLLSSATGITGSTLTINNTANAGNFTTVGDVSTGTLTARPQTNHQGRLQESPHRFWQHSADAAAGSGARPQHLQKGTASCLWSTRLILVFWSPTLQNSQILHPAERFSDVTGLRHRSVFGAKSAQNCQLCHHLLFGCKSAQNRAQFPSFFRGPTARRGPGSECDSPPRWSVSPPSFSPKALKTVESEESVFRVRLQVGCLSLQIRRFSIESGLHTTTLLSFPLSAGNEHVTACHRFVTALFGAEKCAKAPQFPRGLGS